MPFTQKITTVGSLSEATWYGAGELRDYLGLEFPEDKRKYRNFNAKETILDCPATEYHPDNPTFPLYAGLAFNTFYMGAFESSRNPNLERRSLAMVDRPQDTLVIGDAMNSFANNPRHHLLYRPSDIPWHAERGFGEFIYTKHLARNTNFLWVDGHASYEDWEVFKWGKGNNQNYYYTIKVSSDFIIMMLLSSAEFI